ncbi:HD domain-containing protein [Kaistia terrae]|uniref:HD domain-containing protein n=1 Tax=Kaistia terrae TaxID=537017 RepID=A0ABW0PTN6_9HYPH|nr:HD domain-containing protein [Kaistia terrae]MCX5576991.1 HD domain-containing protein [Kaistia terrae]
MNHSPLHRSHGAFAPHEALAEALLPHATSSDDGSHDVAHLQRVWNNAAAILAKEGGASEIVAAATLLHDCVTVEKNDPMRAQASRLAARKAEAVLAELGWDAARIAAVAHAIEAHSFSAAIRPETLEARILQDADRLDAIGMIGVARCFYIAGRMGSGLYDPADPEANWRPLDDKSFAIDHFENKLFKLAAGFQTQAGAQLAELRQARLRRFYDEFLDEI